MGLNENQGNELLNPNVENSGSQQINYELDFMNSERNDDRVTLINECFSGHPLKRHRTRDHNMALHCAVCSAQDIQNTVEYWACEKIERDSACCFYLCVQCRYEKV